jgi:hypothetical protein
MEQLDYWKITGPEDDKLTLMMFLTKKSPKRRGDFDSATWIISCGRRIADG